MFTARLKPRPCYKAWSFSGKIERLEGSRGWSPPVFFAMFTARLKPCPCYKAWSFSGKIERLEGSRGWSPPVFLRCSRPGWSRALVTKRGVSPARSSAWKAAGAEAPQFFCDVYDPAEAVPLLQSMEFLRQDRALGFTQCSEILI